MPREEPGSVRRRAAAFGRAAGDVDIAALRGALVSFLARYAHPSVLGDAFCSLLGAGDGEAKLATLAEAAGFGGDEDGWIASMLELFAAASFEQVAAPRAGDRPIPQPLCMVFLRALLPEDRSWRVRDVERLEALTNAPVPAAERAEMQRVLDTYPVRLSAHTLRQTRISRAVASQYLPFVDELSDEGQRHTWVGQLHRGIVEQMYPNRVILLLNMTCPVYCRYCFRKHKECRGQRPPREAEVDAALGHVAASPAVKEILLTGGDPFMRPAILKRAVSRLGEIEHVETLRLATRSISYYPQLLTQKDRLWIRYLIDKAAALREGGKHLEVATHFVHPDEASLESLEVIAELTQSGVPVYVQTPFVGGCNDGGAILAELFAALRARGAEMHYVFLPCSTIQGNRRYWTSIERALAAASSLRSLASDRCMPHMTTATLVGKVDWYTSGWAREPDEGDSRCFWIRTPYSRAFFARFAEGFEPGEAVRETPEGTLAARFMAPLGSGSLLVGGDGEELVAQADERHGPSVAPDELDRLLLEHAGPALSIVRTGVEGLGRPHRTRAALSARCGDETLAATRRYLEERSEVREIDVHLDGSGRDVPRRVERIVRHLEPLPHLHHFRLRDQAFLLRPEGYGPETVERLGRLNRIRVVDSKRLEVDAEILRADQIGPQQRRLADALRSRGVAVSLDVLLLGGVNDDAEAMVALSGAARAAGVELQQVIVAGHPLQDAWNEEHPIELGRLLATASAVRREGSGREVPRYVVRTTVGDVDFGFGCQLRPLSSASACEAHLLPYDLERLRSIDPSYEWPEGVRVEGDGRPTVRLRGLVCDRPWGLADVAPLD